MADSTIWWLVAGVVVGIELLTGTFYLLMVAIGMVAAALAAHAGASLTVQVITAALVGGGAVVAWHLVRDRTPQRATARTNSDVHMDIGSAIDVPAWNGDGTASVSYRGAAWTVVAADAATATPGAHRVKEVVGNRLVLEKI